MNSDIEQDNEVAANSSVVASGSESQPDTTSSNQDKVSIIGSNPSENQISNKINPTGIDEPPIESLPELPKVVQQREDLEHYSLVNPLEDESEKEAINIRPIIADDVADESMKAELHKVVLIDETLETSENGRKEPTRQAREKEITDNVEEDVDDEIDENIMMDPDHPLLQRVQEAIYEQLSAHEQKLLLEIREREEEANKEKKRREDAGVQLYTVQQQLARLQALFEGSEENYEIIKGLREDAERMLKHTKSDYQKEQEKLKNHTRNLEQHQTELEKLSRSLKQVDLYEEELRSKILVAKRTTLKAEKDIIKQELEKKRQDFFIDHLTEQLRRLQERKMTYDSQLLVQQRETQAATATLHDAATEMEAIQFEKRQLVNQWKSSLIGLKKRTEMLQEIELAITKNNESLRVMNSEIDGFKRTLRKVQEEGENLTSLHNKLESETEYIKRQITSIGEQRDKLSDSYSVYMKSLTQIEQELQVFQQERISVQLEINSVQKATIASTTATQKLEGEIAEKLKLQSSFQKGAQTSQKDGSKLRLLIHEKESAAAAFQNELSVIRLETLNVEASIRNMKEQLKVVDGTIVEKNKLIGKYETEIRQNNDQLSKKASEMDSLNKKYDQMTSGNQDAHMGPLEATIYNISKSIKLKETECLQLQQYWLKAQNEMVTISKDGVELTDLIQSLRMRLTVLNRKKMVVNNAFETEEKQIKEHHRNIRQLQNEMIKVNTLLNKQSNLYGRLEESNLEMEMKFRNKLKDAELDSIHMENQLEKLKAEKEEALVGLIESERQMMLWEKKIQLAKETQSALDPNVGATEIREMTLEIHRMTLRYASMLKLQEKMIAEMEKSVYRRESISTKSHAKGKGSSQASLQKAIIDLTKRIKQAVTDVKECEKDIVELEQSQDIIKEQLEESLKSQQQMEERYLGSELELEKYTARKQMLQNCTLIYQKLQRRYQDMNSNKYKYIQNSAELRVADMDRADVRIQKVKSMVEELQNQSEQHFKMFAEQLCVFIDTTTQELKGL